MNEDMHSELLLKCAVWLARADAFKAESKRAVSRRDQARLSAMADTLEWAAVDLSRVIESLEEEAEPETEEGCAFHEKRPSGRYSSSRMQKATSRSPGSRISVNHPAMRELAYYA
jgi:hypothetical protein